MKFDASMAEVLVFTFKAGALSAVAHDLKLRVTRFQIEVRDDGAVEASFDATSLRVVCARKDGADAPRALPSALFGEVERNIAKDVLASARHGAIRFTGRVQADHLDGALTLCGVTRPLRVVRHEERDAQGRAVAVGRARLDQRDFGIKPFSAALGTLKVQPHVEIEVRLPLPAHS